ncbi:MAG: response regulator [bacterium]|nr:response regulator [bacterium]
MPVPTLIVDDSRLARKLLKDELALIDELEVAEVTNGREALEYVDTHPVEVMFLDLTMPELDGYQVLEVLAKKENSMFIVVVSADIQPKAKERVFSLGAHAFLEKQVDVSKIRRLLEENGVLS